MPSSKNYKRDYKQERKNEKPERKKKRVCRNKARQHAIKTGKVKVGDKKTDIGHIKSLKSGGSCSIKNTKKQSASKNRSHGGGIGSRAGKANNRPRTRKAPRKK